MRSGGWVSWLVVLASLSAVPLRGETVIEAWRSPAGMFAGPTDVSVDSSDGSCWVFDSSAYELVHLSSSGQELLRVGNFIVGAFISASSFDGSCWLGGADFSHISADGQVLLEGGLGPTVCASSYDGSCWTATYWGPEMDHVTHLSASGQVLWQSEQYSFSLPHSLSCNASDGSCWVADEGHHEVVHLAENGEELLRLGLPHLHALGVSVDSSDGSCWVGGSWVETGHLQVLHLSENGEEVGRGGYLDVIEGTDLSASPSDGTCWIADRWDDRVVHMSGTGEVLWESDRYIPNCVSANTADGSCWVADAGNSQVVHLVIARPALSSGYLTPTSGDTSTRFTWRVKYWSTANVAPTAVWVATRLAAGGSPTWRQMWALEPSDTNYVDGKWYTYTCYLAAGSYAYRFATALGSEWAYWPQPTGTYASGPTVAQGNPVALTGGYVTPATGTNATNFTWRVKYWNSTNAAPDEIKVAIWFPTLKTTYWYTLYPYDPTDTNYADGAVYQYSRKWLPAGAYAYRFAARQGTWWAYWPAPAGTYAGGPTVGP